MATFLDLGTLKAFEIIFPFLLIFSVCYAFFNYTNLFGERKSAQAIIAVALSFMTLFSPTVLKAINRMAPWFVLVFVFAMFVLIAYQSFGVSKETIVKVITGKSYGSTFGYWMLAIILIIGIGSVTSIVSEEKGGFPGPGLDANKTGELITATPGDSSTTNVEQLAPAEGGTRNIGFFETVFHPKVLGLALVLLIAMFAMSKLSRPDTIEKDD